MRIATQLRAISVLAFAALAMLGPLLLWSFFEFREAKGDHAMAAAIKVNFFERAAHADQYLLHRESRFRRQWDENKNEADGLLTSAAARFRDGEDRKTLERLHRNTEESAAIFHRIVDNIGVVKAAPGNRSVHEELDKRLSSQLLLRATAIRDAAIALEDASAARVERGYQRLFAVATLFATALALATIFSSIHLARLIRERLAQLRAGARTVAGGDLGHRIPCDGDDEFAELGQSFNTMTTKLRSFTQHLEDEIRVRKWSEEALQESERRYRFMFDNNPQPMWAFAEGSLKFLMVNDTAIAHYGYSRLEFSQMTLRDIRPAEDVPELERAISNSPDGRVCREWRHKKKDGTIIDVMANTVPMNYEGVRARLVLIQDVTAIKEHKRQLERIAHYDALTALPNRVLLSDRLHHGMVQSLRHGRRLAVAYVDLDGFKAVNDRYGHDAGDQLLATIAARMKQSLREGDTLARLGGDEFVAVMLDLPGHEASVPLLARLLAAAAEPVCYAGQTLQVSASVGVTFYPQTEEMDADQLLRQADQAMYQAKLAGRNRFYIFDADQDRQVRMLHEGLERIRLALAQREFVLYYQPKIDMRRGTVVGAEALIRWRHPERGLLPPADFLPLIEDHPLAVELGEWVIDSALAQIERWREAGLDIPVSVNVGVRQIQQLDFVDRLRRLLAAHPGIRPGRFQIEVLETSALEDLAHVSQVIEACREMGVSFALDDFGSGYSSLTYLKRLPVAQLKIDQRFVRDMLVDPEDLAILEGVVGLAAAFRHQAIAEGVETAEHGALLLRLGCELAQGHVFAVPMPGDELPAWLAAWRPNPEWMHLRAVSRDDLPLLFAGVEHRAWIASLDGYLAGEREAPPPLDCHQCRFGEWVDAGGLARRSAEPPFAALNQLHQRVHALAAELCELKYRKGRNAALPRLEELHVLRDSLLKQLDALAQPTLH